MSDQRPVWIRNLHSQFYGPHDFVQTSPCGRGQHHPHGIVGHLWRLKDPETVRVGHCFLRGRLKANDLFLGVAHSGDCFQSYIYIDDYTNCMVGRPHWTFGAYGIGDAEEVPLQDGEFQVLRDGGRVEKEGWNA